MYYENTYPITLSVEWYSCISKTSLPVVLCLFFKKFCVLHVFLNHSLVGFPFLLLFFFLFLKQFSNSVILLANVWTPLVALDVSMIGTMESISFGVK